MRLMRGKCGCLTFFMILCRKKMGYSRKREPPASIRRGDGLLAVVYQLIANS